MPVTAEPREGRTALIVPVLGASVAGAALQLQQPALWPVAAYMALVAAGAVLLVLAASKKIATPWPVVMALAGALLMGSGGCGWRAQAFASQALAPDLQGRDLVVTGVVSAMPQRNETGLRLRLAVESAWLGAHEVALPPRLQLGWYGGMGAGELTRQPADVRAGERWQMTVRLKAPHGHLNPHGFDYELWLWEQGIHATGYIRAGPGDAPPRRMGVTWQHPVEQARQTVRDAIFARVDDRKLAGIVAALVTGDQNAIDLGASNYVLLPHYARFQREMRKNGHQPLQLLSTPTRPTKTGLRDRPATISFPEFLRSYSREKYAPDKRAVGRSNRPGKGVE
jgi:competence protein ComEC